MQHIASRCADHFTRFDNRCGNESRSSAVARGVRSEVARLCARSQRGVALASERGANQLGEIRFCVATLHHRTDEVSFFEYGVHNHALAINQEHVVVAESFQHAAQTRMMLCVRAIKRGVDVERVEFVLRAHRIGIAHDVAIL